MATYDEIVSFSEIASYLANRDTADHMPTLVAQAQEYLVERIDHDFFRRSAVPAEISADGVLVMPEVDGGEILELRSISAEVWPGQFNPLVRRNLEMLMALHFGSGPGVPMQYAQEGDEGVGAYRVFPPPGRPMAARIGLNVAPPVLSPDVPSNKISERFPTLFRTAVAREVALFNLDQGATELYAARAAEHLESANAQISRWARDESGQRPVDPRNVIGQ